MKTTILLTVAMLFTVSGCNESKRGHDPSPPASGPAMAKDNTGVNVRDRFDEVKTPINQNENQADIDLTAKIRKRVVDANLSVNAQNVKIITQDGKVTLRGPVRSADEKTHIEQIAGEVAGVSNIVSQIDIQP